MTALLTHTAPVPLPAMKAGGPALPPARGKAPADIGGTGPDGIPSCGGYAVRRNGRRDTPDTAGLCKHGLSGRAIQPEHHSVPARPAPATGADSLAAEFRAAGG